MAKFKVGDQVEIVKKVDYGVHWNEHMENTIGLVGEVVGIGSDGEPFCVAFEYIDGRWWYHPDSLGLVERAAESISQEEMDDRHHNDKKDMINPSHYGADGKIECIDVMLQQFGVEEVQSFCKLNAFKYMFRMGHKDEVLQEAKKIQWYIDKFIELEEKKDV